LLHFDVSITRTVLRCVDVPTQFTGPRMLRETQFDCAVVGAGIVGLAHALCARRAGLSVVVIDRDAVAAGASVRNFGFVTVTGQGEGATWRRARRSRDIWADVAPRAGITVVHRGLTVAARRPEALACLKEFLASPMSEGCRVLRQSELPAPFRNDLAGGLYSPHELRVESRTAIARLTALLQVEGVTFLTSTAAHGVEGGMVSTSAGTVRAEHVVVCPGADLVTLCSDVIKRREVGLTKLHMMRLAAPGWQLPSAVMSDLGLVRYLGYAGCPSLPALRARLEAEQEPHLASGVHLIAVQEEDGSLVVGDSHHRVAAADPFQPDEIDELILDELRLVLDLPTPRVVERWVGFYPSSAVDAFIEVPAPGVRLVMVTSGTGASTAFAIAEETMADLLGYPPPPHAV
jgi:D-hydroxyproline dehydrogenase subunit beta